MSSEDANSQAKNSEQCAYGVHLPVSEPLPGDKLEIVYWK